ncbi:MAG: thioredoxin family protein [Eubacteriales bacterium]|nr:thioredoxin family protein [Eubacteriales bacterium]
MKKILNNALRLGTILLPAISLYWYGVVRDRNNIVGEATLSTLLDALMIVAILVTLVSVANKKSRVQMICTGTSALIIATSLFTLGIVYGKDTHNLHQEDYISSEYIRGITLAEVQKSIQSDEENVIYIGRDDCESCAQFEKEYEKILRKYSVEGNGYYTNMDRDNANTKAMNQFLKNYKITKVPTLVVVRKGKITHTFNTDDIGKIDSYYRKNFS